ncbi:hypothetical protein HRM2_05580 [Desulforapulum autotrophicum HRM2]|uniref:Uncharacterized protein n=1 Tax=Desulforapulum autotrophicum (strain ATCC 43914 / DSM 3382 / VKM B-1955 / HRM2) TaxID=177437 RepID=C0QHW4_DESAH|nr:hypothetical protein HRM2_05580 [Desulforapulum autotrophicum HRM2]
MLSWIRHSRKQTTILRYQLVLVSILVVVDQAFQVRNPLPPGNGVIEFQSLLSWIRHSRQGVLQGFW